MNTIPKFLSSSLVHKGNYFTVIREKLELNSGATIERDRVDHRGAVVIVPITKEGNFLMIEQFRFSVRETLLEFPAGTLEVGEPPLECAKREVIEEVGHSAQEWISLGKCYPAPGFCNEVQHIFVANDLAPAHGELDEDEIIKVVTLTPDELFAKIARGEVLDSKTVAVAFRVKLAGIL